MNAETAKEIIVDCHRAEHILSMLPELPPGATPQLIRIIDVIHDLELSGTGCCVSDISREMNLSLPGATRSLKQLAKLGAVVKTPSPEDGRRVRIELTDFGRKWYTRYVDRFYKNMAEAMEDISDEKIQIMTEALKDIEERMKTIK